MQQNSHLTKWPSWRHQ